VNKDELMEIFIFHPVKIGQAEKYQAMREMGMKLAFLIDETCPQSREKSLAITKVQEAIMFANASIAIHT